MPDNIRQPSGPPLNIGWIAYWVSNSASTVKPIPEGATTTQWLVTVGVVGGCALEVIPPAADGNAEEAIKGLYDCAKAISDNQDAITAVAQDMWNFANNVFNGNGSPSDPQLQETTVDQFIGMANDLMPGGYGQSSEVCTFQDSTGNGQYSNATTFDVNNYSGDWGDQQVFQAISGTDTGFSFQGDFQQAGFPGSVMRPSNDVANAATYESLGSIPPTIGSLHPIGFGPPSTSELATHGLLL